MAKTTKKTRSKKAPKTGPTAPIELNVRALDELLERGLKIKPVAACLNMSQETLRRRIKEISGQTFEEYRLKKVSGTAKQLIEKAIDMAMNGDAKMMQLCLINLAGWTNRLEHDVSDEHKELVLSYNLNQPRDVTPPIEAKDGDSKD